MINPPSTFGQPEEAPVASEPEPVTTRSPRTVVVVAVAGVAALAVLGGAAALVLTSGDAEVETALPASSVAPVEPSVAPSTAAATPLPTSAVRGRNVFLPLVADAGSEGEGAEGAGAALPDTSGVQPDPVSTAGSSGSGSSGSGSAGSGSSGTGVVVLPPEQDPVAEEVLRAAIEEIARLEAEIVDLKDQLDDASDDEGDLVDTIADLESERDGLSRTVDELTGEIEARDEVDASRLLVEFVSADPEELVVEADGTEITIAFGEDEEVAKSSTGQALMLTYHGLDEGPDPDHVRFGYVDVMSVVQVGATVVLPR